MRWKMKASLANWSGTDSSWLDHLLPQNHRLYSVSQRRPLVNHQIAAKSVYLNLNRIMWQPWPRDPNWLRSRCLDLNILWRSIGAGAVEIKLQMIWASCSFGNRRRGGGAAICKLTYRRQKLAILLFLVLTPSILIMFSAYLSSKYCHIFSSTF